MQYPYMGMARHFHVIFDVRVLDLNLSNISYSTAKVQSKKRLDRSKQEVRAISRSVVDTKHFVNLC